MEFKYDFTLIDPGPEFESQKSGERYQNNALIVRIKKISYIIHIESSCASIEHQINV